MKSEENKTLQFMLMGKILSYVQYETIINHLTGTQIF